MGKQYTVSTELVVKFKKFQDGMKKASQSTKDFSQDFQKKVKENQKKVEKFKEEIEDIKPSFDKVKTGITVGVTAIVGAFGGAVIATDKFQKSLNNLQASTGASNDEIAEMEGILKDLYTNNYGDSFNDLASSIGQVKQVTGATGEELKSMTKNAIIMRDTFGKDVGETINTANSLMKQFGIDSEEAFNLMAQGIQNGADKNGDLFDTLNEYAPQFKALGFNAEEFTNVLIDGAENGAFSVDKVGDAIKEFNIRAKDGSDTTKEAFEAIGLDADSMTSKFAQGGSTAQKAFQQVIQALNNVNDPVTKNIAAVGLFGTQIEDLEMGAISSFANIGNKADATKDTLQEIDKVKYNSIGEAFQGIGRQIVVGLIDPIEDEAMPTMNKMVNWFQKNMPQIKKTVSDSLTFVINMGKGIYNNWNIIEPILAGVVGGFLAFKTIGFIVGLYKAITTAQLTLNAVMAANPIGMVATAIGLLILAGVALVRHWDKVEAKAGEFKLAIVNGWSSVVDWFEELPEEFEQFGKDIVNGMVNGVTSLISKVKESAENIGNSVKNSLKKVLGIASPSKVTYQYGKWTVEGLVNAIRDGKTDVKKAVEEMLSESDFMIQRSQKILSTYNYDSKEYRQELKKQIQMYKDRQKMLNIQADLFRKEIKNEKLSIEKKQEMKDKINQLSLAWWDLESQIKQNNNTLRDYEIAEQKRIEELEMERLERIQEAEKESLEKRKNLADKIIDIYKDVYAKQKEIALNSIDDEMEALEESHNKKLRMYDKDLDEFEKSINRKLDLIDEQQEKEDYEEQLKAEQTKQLELQNQINILSLDNSMATQAKKVELENELARVTNRIEKMKEDRSNYLRKQSLREELQSYREQIAGKKNAENEKFKAEKERLEQSKIQTERYYENLINDERRFNKIRENIIDGHIDNVKDSFSEFKSFLEQNSKSLGESLTQNLIDKMKETQQLLDQITGNGDRTGDGDTNDWGEPNDQYDHNNDGDRDDQGEPDYGDDTDGSYTRGEWARDSVKRYYENRRDGESLNDYRDRTGDHFDSYHTGGWVGGIRNAFASLKSNELPAILQKGEFVLSRAMVNSIADFGRQMNNLQLNPQPITNSSNTENNYNVNFHIDKLTGDKKGAETVFNTFVNGLKKRGADI